MTVPSSTSMSRGASKSPTNTSSLTRGITIPTKKTSSTVSHSTNFTEFDDGSDVYVNNSNICLNTAGGIITTTSTTINFTSTTVPDIDNDIDRPRDNSASLNFLNLPEELQTLIILNLNPREAIFLSLTCRTLYHGVLAERNHFIWFALGGFAHGAQDALPAWLECIHSNMRRKYPPEIYDLPLPISRDVSQGTLTVTAEDFIESKSELSIKKFETELQFIIDAMQDVTPLDTFIAPGRTARSLDRHYRMSPKRLPAQFVPGWFYKRVLVGTMLGMDDLGCQWCLRTWWIGSPPKSWGKLKMKLCNDCFRVEMLPMQALDALPSEIKDKLKAEEWLVTREQGWDGLSDLSAGRIWRHKVERVARQVLADSQKLDDLLPEDRKEVDDLLPERFRRSTLSSEDGRCNHTKKSRSFDFNPRGC